MGEEAGGLLVPDFHGSSAFSFGISHEVEPQILRIVRVPGREREQDAAVEEASRCSAPGRLMASPCCWQPLFTHAELCSVPARLIPLLWS